MDGSMVTAVEFDEVKRGYDPEQVENYLSQLGDKVTALATNLRKAVDTAEAAEARAVAALKERDDALARAEDAEARLAGGDDGTDALRKMLMLAQRTADAAVEEAQASAKNIVADGRSKAAELVADAEKRAERLLVEAQKVCDEMMQEKSAEIVETVTGLEARRDALLADATSLSRHVHDQRLKLQQTLSSLRQVVEATSDLEVGPPPRLETGSTASTAPDAKGASGAGDTDSKGDPPEARRSTVSSGAPPPPPPPGGSGATSGSPAAAPRPASAPDRIPVVAPDEGREPSGGSPTASLLIEEPLASLEVEEIAVVRAPAVDEAPVRPARPPLFDVDLDDDTGLGGPPTAPLTAAQPGDPPAGEDPLLGGADAEADEAMRRFFDEELPASDRKKRFRRS